MKIVTGLFQPEDAIFAVRRLINHGFGREDLSMVSTIADLPEYIEEVESEDAAITGAAAGAVTGSSVGALGSWVVSTIPGLESVFVSGFLMATAIGGIVGGFLGSLYSVRADEQSKINMHDELAAGKVLVVANISGKTDAETAVTLMKESSGEHVNAHVIPEEEVAAGKHVEESRKQAEAQEQP